MNNEITTYGSNNEIAMMAKRYKTAMRGGEKMTDHEAYALAQIAKLTMLNPFTGELWYIPGKGPMIGIAGARRLWNEQAKQGGGGYSYIEILPCSPEEAGATEKDVVVAFKAVAHDSKATSEYQKIMTETINSMRASGSSDPFGDAKEICGPRPQWVGYGYSTHSETSRMNKTQLARKRAEADALKKCITVPFGAEVASYDTATTYIEGTATDVSEATDPITIEVAREMRTGKGTRYADLNPDQLTLLINHEKATPAQREAALLVLAEDFKEG